MLAGRLLASELHRSAHAVSLSSHAADLLTQEPAMAHPLLL